MTISQKKFKTTAARLVEISRGADGRVDSARVKTVLTALAETFPAQILRPLLKTFYAAVARELRFSEARIEFAGALPAGATNALAARFSEIYGRAIVPVAEENPALLGGVRAQVGDDVYDATLAGALARLHRTLSA